MSAVMDSGEGVEEHTCDSEGSAAGLQMSMVRVSFASQHMACDVT